MSSIDRLNAQDAARLYIQNADVARAGAPARAADATKADQQPQAPRADSVTLSDNARSLAAARDAVQNAPDVREQKVAEIKQSVTDGTYSVPSSVLARNMLDASNSSV